MATGLLTLGILFLTVVHSTTSASSCEDTGCSDLFSGQGRCVDLRTVDRASLETYAQSTGTTPEGCSCHEDNCACLCVNKKQEEDRAGKTCKASSKCSRKQGNCLRPGSQPKGAKDLGLCDKKTKCRCYKSTTPTTPAATTTGPPECPGPCSCSWSWTCAPGCPWQAPPATTPPTTPATTTPGSPAISGLIILAGGRDGSADALSTVETFPPSCSIPPLPEARDNLTLTLLPGSPPSLVVCGGGETLYTKTSCLAWRKGQDNWTHTGYTLMEERDGHTAAAIAGGQIMLLNGGGNGNGEIAGVEATLSTPNRHSRGSCAFAVQEGGKVVVTGGGNDWYSGGVTTVYRLGSNTSDPWYLGRPVDYPVEMRQGRRSHGCAVFSNSTGTFYLVTGGFGNEWSGLVVGNQGFSQPGLLATTEIYAEDDSGGWQLAAALPWGLYDMNCASPGGGTVICTGGRDMQDYYRDEVLQYKPWEDTWEEVGKLSDPRASFGMAATGDLNFCEDPDQ